MTRIPLPHPNGWLAVARSEDVPAGQVVPAHYLERDFALFRGEDGAVRALDAFCPHLGAHLAFGGKVEGNEVRCPFHAWKWSGDTGACTEIPYAKRIPPRAKIGTWRALERNGYVFVWHHAGGAEPHYEIDPIPELEDPAYRLAGHYDWTVATHPQEIVENGVDIQHFTWLHGWTAREIRWVPDGVRASVTIDVDSEKNEAATAQNATDVDSFNCGPGYLFTRVTGAMRAIAVNCLTPIEPEKTHVMHSYWVHESVPKEMADGFVEAYKRDWELDIPIWDHKVFRDRPVLAENDGEYAKYRRWYQQFYS